MAWQTIVISMVDLQLAERILNDIRENIRDLRSADDISWEVYMQDKRSRRFVERTLHITVEGMIDLAQHIISDEKLREPLNFRDAFLVLAEEGIISRKNLPVYEKMASFRNLIVHYYEKIDNEIVFGIFKRNLSDFELFVNEISRYLKDNTIAKQNKT